MSLIEDIRKAQITAGENVVMESLRKKGLIKEPEIIKGKLTFIQDGKLVKGLFEIKGWKEFPEMLRANNIPEDSVLRIVIKPK